MTNFVEALERKIRDLQESKTELLSAIEVIEAKIETLSELLSEESNPSLETIPTTKKKGGRPKGSKNKAAPASSAHAPNDDLYQEALRQVASLEGGGTTKDLQERRVKQFSPQPRPPFGPAAGITAGSKKDLDKMASSRKADFKMSMDDEE